MTKQEAINHVKENMHESYTFNYLYGWDENYIQASLTHKKGYDVTFIIDFKHGETWYENE